MRVDEASEQPGCSSQLPAPQDGVALSCLPDARPTPSQSACLPGPRFQTVSPSKWSHLDTHPQLSSPEQEKGPLTGREWTRWTRVCPRGQGTQQCHPGEGTLRLASCLISTTVSWEGLKLLRTLSLVS